MTLKKSTTKKENSKTPSSKRKGSGLDEVSRIYDFGNSVVLLTHPDINQGETVHGRFVGNWETKEVSRTEFLILTVEAKLVLPEMNWKLPKRETTTRVAPGSINLSLAKFEVPSYLKEIFPSPNRGVVDIRNRMYHAVFSMNADLSFAHSKSGFLELLPADLLLLTIGNIEKDGSLSASGIGRIVSGPFAGLMFSCGHPSSPPKCGAVYPKDGRRCVKTRGHAGRHFNPLRPRVAW